MLNFGLVSICSSKSLDFVIVKCFQSQCSRQSRITSVTLIPFPWSSLLKSLECILMLTSREFMLAILHDNLL
uniref:Uncharacterized protein n=1 Tax=Amphimedon queenslandica TaxID=400682 RepID=A0A1X7T5W4_AMPQE